MTIQRALILGISLILAVVACSQLLSLWWLQQQLQQEITKQSGQLSQIVLARTAEKIQFNPHVVVTTEAPTAISANSSAEKSAVHTASPTANHNPQSTDKNSQVTTTVTQRIITTKQGTEAAHEVRVFKIDNQKALPEVLQIELAETLQELNNGQAISRQGDASPWVQQFKFDSTEQSQSIIEKYLGYQILALLVSLALALSLALWLGYRFIAPLQQLVQGFRRLASGESAVQLDSSQGLTEYRFVLSQFNLASKQLSELAADRAYLAEQQQLIELGEISRGLVHALRNPIHTMALALEQIPTLSEQHQQIHKLLEQKMQHINRTLTALLTLSCEGVDRSQPVLLNTVLQDIALEFSQAEVQLQLDLPEPLLINGAEAELRSIAHAVICNAVEASPPLGIIQVRLQKHENHIELTVSDQGQGLSAAMLANLFQPHISSKAEGAGMGLYLCRRLLQRYYDGDISIQNIPKDPSDGLENSSEVRGCLAKITFGVLA